MRVVLAALAACAAVAQVSAHASAHDAQERSIEIDGATLRYTVRSHPPDAHRFDPAAELSPARALDTAKLLNQYLTAGRIEDAALLSNAPKRRFAVLQDYRKEVGEEAFQKVFEEYFYPENRLAAELAIGEHTLLIWHLAQSDRYAGLYFMHIEGRALVDDVPSESRTQLRRLLEAYRSGALPR